MRTRRPRAARVVVVTGPGSGLDVSRPTHCPEELTLSEWRRVTAVNLDSQFLVTQAFLQDMKALRCGRIVNMTSALAWDAQSGVKWCPM